MRIIDLKIFDGSHTQLNFGMTLINTYIALVIVEVCLASQTDIRD